jgi:hypothetical protein
VQQLYRDRNQNGYHNQLYAAGLDRQRVQS